MAKPAARIVALQIALGAATLLVVGRAAHLQLVRGEEFATQARKERTRPREIEARRGTITDRNGAPLAVSRSKYHLGIALDQVRDTARIKRLVARDLGIRPESLGRAFRRKSPRWLYFHGPYTATQIDGLRRLRGVYPEEIYLRAYPEEGLAAPIVGTLVPEGKRGASGLERYLDTLLAGTPGLTVDLKDRTGRRFESPGRRMREPVAGHDVVLTLDAELQAIAEHGLSEALREFRAQGGDVVFLDPKTGELLALVSRTAHGAAATASVFTGVFEPGSTAKPFTAAALLALGRVGATDAVSGEAGEWVFETSGGAKRRISDTHKVDGLLTLAQAIQVSSNIAMAKFSRRLRPEEHYDVLRSFGFGGPTGVEFPSEGDGVLRRPHTWRTGYDAESAAMGYGFSVTPVQLAAAYGALANEGVLMAPALVKEIRAADGSMVYGHRPEVVRRVVSPELAKRMLGLLVDAASDSGTGGQAQVRHGVLGKTGTSREMTAGRYVQGAYRASFAGMFPAKDPQIAFVVTIDRPQGLYYGGQIAAPLTGRMLRQALAARRSAIDRRALADATAEQPPPSGKETEKPTASVASIGLPAAASSSAAKRVSAEVPDVAGLRVRAAALALHRRGFRVRIAGSGVVVRSIPAAGEQLETGRVVTLHASASGPSQ
jgi:cell division protein FtsI (penicillin-binding protein 3)